MGLSLILYDVYGLLQTLTSLTANLFTKKIFQDFVTSYEYPNKNSIIINTSSY